MERLKKIRQPVRSSFTKNHNELVDELKKDDRDADVIRQRMKLLETTFARMEELDRQLIEAMVDEDRTEDDVNKEQEGIDEYHSRYIALMTAVEPIVYRRPVSPTPSEISTESAVTRKKTYRLPQTEIRKFRGEITEWLSWWAQFEKIHEDPDLHNADKFQYLVQSMEEGSKAADLVRVYPQTAANYLKVVDALRERFGKDKILKRVYVRELLKMIINNSREKTSISRVYDKLEAHLKALESLGITQDQMDVLLFPMVESCLPDDILMAWQRSPNFGRDGKREDPPMTEFNYMMEFIRQEVENENQRAIAHVGFAPAREFKNSNPSHVKKSFKGDIATATSLFNKPEPPLCAFCGRTNHASQDCLKATNMSLEERRNKVRADNRCYCCLKIGHAAKKCNNKKVQCGHCSRRHYSLMCSSGEQKDNQRPPPRSNDVEGGQTMLVTAPSNGLARQLQSRVVLMKTLCVRARGTTGMAVEVRLLFDEGSQRSYIKTSVAKELRCKVLRDLTLQNNLFGGVQSEAKRRQCYLVEIEGAEKKHKGQFELVNEDVICTGCPVVPVGPWMDELTSENIHISDIRANGTEIEILIGSDLWGDFMTGRMKKLSNGMIAVESIFGWTVSGPLPTGAETSIASTVISLLTNEKRSLEELWSLEAIGIRDSAERISQEEHDYMVKQTLQEKIERQSDGRYMVRLPWISSSTELPANRRVAERRLIAATEKLKKQDGYRQYDQIFREWEKEGIIERVPPEKEGIGHFLPHRAVYKPDSLTTPIRPVFDASCRVGKQPSLNQCLEKGPNLLELIPAILLRFRERKIGVIADIRKAFLMVGVAEEDRKYQKFLWWESEDSIKMIEFQHSRVVFGMTCSPFVLAAVLDLHLSNVHDEDKPIVEQLLKSLYVDNCVISVDDETEYKIFRERSTSILAEALMNLRQWESNVEKSEQPVTSILGLKWNKEEDMLFCKVPQTKEGLEINKRNVLSIVSQIFDPIGYTCPALIKPKMMLQDSWAVALDWDASWNSLESERFNKWQSELQDLNKIKIPRIAFGGYSSLMELHMFSDASKNAYAAVVFSRIMQGEETKVHIIGAKSRLAPLNKRKAKEMTIPRLELMGCLIGSRLVKSIVEASSFGDLSVYCWTDSTTALAWIKRNEDWGTFVGLRAKEINRLTLKSNWNHVPGTMNPADLPSRGCTPSELLRSAWWEGPAWLKEKINWPNGTGEVDEDTVKSEKRKTPVVAVIATESAGELRFSSYLGNVRVAAWVRRFADNAKRVKDSRLFSKYLTADEMRRGEMDLLRGVQRRHYQDRPNVKNLSIDNIDGLYRVLTRLTYLEDTIEFRKPVLLPKDEPIVHQLIEHVHRTNCHAGTQFVLGKLRERYWIVHGRKTVSRLIKKCVVCRRHTAKGMISDPAPLPSLRVNPQFAFQTTGVDLAGPLFMKGGKKNWIVLYTDALYRGVYLDVVDSLSTEEFLDSLEKFTFMVGRPSTIYSDNGTNFVGASNLLKKLNWLKLESRLQVKQIRWTFNPPTAAWWGGWWERLVRTIKDLLKRMIGTAKLTRKELVKCLAAISHTVNNRPLTTLTEDCEDLVALTPAMFMRDLPIAGLPERDGMVQEDFRKAYQKLLNLKKALRERFRKEYLALLVHRQQEKNVNPPEVGDVVLVGQDNKKRFEWPLGRVVALFPGKDGKIRLAKVKTGHGYLMRPLQRLYLLEVSSPKKAEFPIPVKEAAAEKPDDHVEGEEQDLLKTRSGS